MRRPTECPVRVLPLLLLGAIAAACTAAEKEPDADTVADNAAAAVVAGTDASRWAPDVGSMLIVPSDSENMAVVLVPDAPSPRLVASSQIRLFLPSGDSSLAKGALVVSDSQVCGEAPLVELREGALAEWAVGIVGGSAEVVRTDSIGAMPARDSILLAAEMARLASTLPMRPESRFKGLPFVLLSAGRFSRSDSQITISHLVRRVPQEAAPLEEHTFLVAERAGTASPYRVAFQQRSEGSEEAADNYEVLAALRGQGTTWLLMAADNVAQTTYQLLERSSDGRWSVRWSRRLSC